MSIETFQFCLLLICENYISVRDKVDVLLNYFFRFRIGCSFSNASCAGLTGLRRENALISADTRCIYFRFEQHEDY